MRTILLLALALSLHAAAAPKTETFTLTDGRTLVGVYDEGAQTLTLAGGKASLQVRPDQIAERGPAKVEAKPEESVPERAAPQLTEAEKAERARKVGEAAKVAERDKEIAEAAKAERDAAAYTQKAESRRDQARRDALMFQKRAHQEGHWWEVATILAQPLSVRRTSANNSAILALLVEAKKYDGLAADRLSAAATKRAKAGVTAGASASAPDQGQLQTQLAALDQQISELQDRRAALAAQLAK